MTLDPQTSERQVCFAGGICTDVVPPPAVSPGLSVTRVTLPETLTPTFVLNTVRFLSRRPQGGHRGGGSNRI